MRQRILLSAAVVVVGAIVSLGVYSAWDSSHGTNTTLPDGTRVECIGSTLGTARFSTEKAWHRIARRVLPNSLGNWVPRARSGSCGGNSNTMTVFIEAIDSAGAASPSMPSVSYGAQMENGERLQTEGGYCGYGSGLFGLTMRTWPRRESSFRMNLFDGKGNVLGGLRIPNPVKGPFPVWSPRPLPQTQTNGSVVVTLKSVWESRPASAWPAALANWEVHSPDPQWRSASVRFTTFHDATGNEGQWLPRNEPAWKAVALVYRMGMDDFLPAERIVVEGVAIPKTAEFIALDQTIEREDVKIILHVLAGAGRLHITNGLQRAMTPPVRGEGGHSTSSNGRVRTESWGSERPFLLFEVQGQQNNDLIELILRDEQGRILKADPSSSWGSGTGWTHLRRFTPPAEAKSVSIEMAVNRPLPFEFIFDPAALRTPPPPE